MIGLGILDIETQSNSLKIKMGSKVIKFHQCSLEKFHAASIEINSEYNQGLTFLDKNRSLGQLVTNVPQNNEDFLVQLLNAWLHFTNNNSPVTTSVKEILDQTIFLNPQSKLITCIL